MRSRYASTPAASPEASAEPPFHCPVCHRSIAAEARVSGGAVPPDLASLVTANTPGWEPRQGLCRDCARRFGSALDALRRHGISMESMPILPTPLRIGAPDAYRGRGVTIAFLDSGFYAHPDLVTPTNRILAYHSIFAADGDVTSLETNDVASWHGMMTSVVATGNGGLVAGFYRGIASE